MAHNHMLADVVTIIGTQGIVYGEVFRKDIQSYDHKS